MFFAWRKVHMGFIYCISLVIFKKPFRTSFAEALFFLGRNHPKTHHPKKPDHSYANTIPSVYDTPGASKQVNLTPHDIPRILRAQKNMFFLFFCGQKKILENSLCFWSQLLESSSPKSIPVENNGHYLMLICSIVNDLSQNLGYPKKRKHKQKLHVCWYSLDLPPSDSDK